MDASRRYSRPMPRTPEGAGPQRRSMAVPLMLVGALGLTLWKCSGTDVQRNRYSSLEDCAKDYSMQQCNADYPVGSSGSSSGVHYYGPWYRSRSGSSDSADPGPGRSGGFARATGEGGPSGVELGSRGGFGASGRVSARGS